MTEEHLQRFVAAWVRRDVDGLMEFITEDCIYETATGPEPGQTFVGRDAIRQKFAAQLADDEGTCYSWGPALINGDTGLMEWEFQQGEARRQRGCDLYKFRGDKICHKNVFLKAYA